MAAPIEEGFRRRLEGLPPGAHRFLTVATADPTGDPALVWRASGRMGVRNEDASAAFESGLIEIGTRVLFRHPLVRSATYQAAALDDRRGAHRALAEATDADADADLRAWHRALAAAGPDEEVAAELERSARRAQARGGLAASAALLERAAALTVDMALRARRTIAAADAHINAGSFEAGARLLAEVRAGPLDERSRARVELIQGRAASLGVTRATRPRLGPPNVRQRPRPAGLVLAPHPVRQAGSGASDGIAVHIGARVSALARPGEVLLSRTVVDLVTGSGIEFVERGVHHLKGVHGSWKLFAVID
jgi:hypothetical protein